MSNLRRVEKNGKLSLVTRNLAPGIRVYNEDLVAMGGEEYRTWDPYRSKLAAALIKGLTEDVLSEGETVLYLGSSTGTTASHVSDIVGQNGLVVAVEFAPRVAREFIERVAKNRSNVIPYVEDARHPERYAGTGKVDLVYCDIAQPDQTDIAVSNCRAHLKPTGILLLVVKSRSIDVVKDPKLVFEEEKRKVRECGFEVVRLIDLEPFDKDHAMIYARQLSS